MRPALTSAQDRSALWQNISPCSLGQPHRLGQKASKPFIHLLGRRLRQKRMWQAREVWRMSATSAYESTFVLLLDQCFSAPLISVWRQLHQHSIAYLYVMEVKQFTCRDAGLSEDDLQLLACTLFIGCCASYCSESLAGYVRTQLQVSTAFT